jgi:hypothetical protein
VLYDVERLIRAGRPLQLPAVSPGDRRPVRTALEIALERQDHSLVLLLVANGYDLGAEPECPLDAAFRLRRRDLLDLLLAWGADPLQADLEALCDSYDSELYERFRVLGVDFASGHALAYALGYHTSNKPLFGFAKRHRPDEPGIQRELDMALARHAGEGNEKGVMLCLWAGADAHAPAPDLDSPGPVEDDEDEEEWYSAVYQACSHGHAAILERLGPDPSRDDYEELYLRAPNEQVVEILARSALPRDHSTVVRMQLARLSWFFGGCRPVETLRALLEAGVRWHADSTSKIGDARRDLLKAKDWTFAELMQLLATDDYCSEEVLTELARTPTMRKRMKRVGLIPESSRHRSDFDRSRPARARETLARFGVQVPKPRKAPVVIPSVVRIGGWSSVGRVLRLGRSELFERVWTVPVETLAKEWGLSGRGAATPARAGPPIPTGRASPRSMTGCASWRPRPWSISIARSPTAWPSGLKRASDWWTRSPTPTPSATMRPCRRRRATFCSGPADWPRRVQNSRLRPRLPATCGKGPFSSHGRTPATASTESCLPAAGSAATPNPGFHGTVRDSAAMTFWQRPGRSSSELCEIAASFFLLTG